MAARMVKGLGHQEKNMSRSKNHWPKPVFITRIN